jgi:hypothetical protein
MSRLELEYALYYGDTFILVGRLKKLAKKLV